MKIMIVTDAWEPQVNGVVRTLKMTVRELELRGHHIDVVSPMEFRSFPCPTYPEISLAVTTTGTLAKRIDQFAPDCLHIATEGPLGWKARRIAIRRGWPFTTAYHSRFPEYVHARTRIPVQWTYPLLRTFHNAGQATLAPTPAIVDELRVRGFRHPRLWSRGVDLSTFSAEGDRIPAEQRPVFLYVGRIAVEKQVDHFLRLQLPGQKWVAGDGPDARKLKERFPDARWFGVLSGPELARLYRSADVLVFPSVTDTFGLVMVEAMACGTPVAAYPVVGPIDVVGRSAGGVLDERLDEACRRALHLSRVDVRRHAEQYSWSAATDQILAALQPIVQGDTKYGSRSAGDGVPLKVGGHD